jgi:hypothetical protein
MFVQLNLEPDSFQIIKISEKKEDRPTNELMQSDTQLGVLGITEEGQVVFNFTDTTSDISTSFGVSLKKYFGQDKSTDELSPLSKYLTECRHCLGAGRRPEGAYLFIPDMNNSLPSSFGQVDEEVLYQKGQFIEQWTISLKGETESGLEQGLIKVRNSPLFQGLVEFEVELDAIPVVDYRSKDVTVNWKFYDGFDSQGTFYTDSNALEMQQR